MSDIFRGTTPTITVTVNLDLTGYTCYLSIGRKSNQARVTAKNDQMEMSVEGNVSTLAYTLTQDQTLALSEGEAQMQLRVIEGDTALASEWVPVTIGGILQNGKIDDEY
jgi:hypothetical protein